MPKSKPTRAPPSDTAPYTDPGVLHGHSGGVMSLVHIEDGTIATGGYDCSIKLWKHRKEALTLRGHLGCVTVLASNSSASMLVSGSDDHTVKVWDTEKEACVRTHTESVGSITSLGVAGSLVGLSTRDGFLSVIDLRQEEKVLRQKLPPEERVLLISVDRTSISFSQNREIKYLPLSQRTPLTFKTSHTKPIKKTVLLETDTPTYISLSGNIIEKTTPATTETIYTSKTSTQTTFAHLSTRLYISHTTGAIASLNLPPKHNHPPPPEYNHILTLPPLTVANALALSPEHSHSPPYLYAGTSTSGVAYCQVHR
ncbi:hypothetical protein NEDG_01645 [Nematocida displodere]|uniref:Uncharacterized protein n=1 Tax=Nematocida displodere TaxID=1805483 RepID=A0A177EJC5_9MICR|nr:hypothetical protein NEDG_01645 [Nematocida displodere]